MLSESQVRHFWNYAEILNEQLANTTRYVDPHPDNMKTFSLEYTRIILSSGSEIEVICRLICDEIDPSCTYTSSDNRADMGKIAKKLRLLIPHLYMAKMKNPITNQCVMPFSSWEQKPSAILAWWEDYNLIKHYRHNEFTRATLENAMNCVAALIILVSYLYTIITKQATPRMTRNGFFDSEYAFAGLALCPVEKLPDIELITGGKP